MLYVQWASLPVIGCLEWGWAWTAPFYRGLHRACEPRLITFCDGRVALSWRRRYAEGWSKETPEGDRSVLRYPGGGFTYLAAIDDGAQPG